MRKLRDAGGVTLIELLVVLVVVAILAAVAIPSYTGMVDKTKISAAGVDLTEVIRGFHLYQTEDESNHFPATSMITSYVDLSLVVSDYIGALPQEEESPFRFISYTSDDTSFTITVSALDTESTVLIGSTNGIRRQSVPTRRRRFGK